MLEVKKISIAILDSTLLWFSHLFLLSLLSTIILKVFIIDTLLFLVIKGNLITYTYDSLKINASRSQTSYEQDPLMERIEDSRCIIHNLISRGC